eukprot:05711_6
MKPSRLPRSCGHDASEGDNVIKSWAGTSLGSIVSTTEIEDIISVQSSLNDNWQSSCDEEILLLDLMVSNAEASWLPSPSLTIGFTRSSPSTTRTSWLPLLGVLNCSVFCATGLGGAIPTPANCCASFCTEFGVCACAGTEAHGDSRSLALETDRHCPSSPMAIWSLVKSSAAFRAVPTFEAHPKGGTGGLELDAGARVSAGPRGVLIIARSVSAFCFVFAPVS